MIYYFLSEFVTVAIISLSGLHAPLQRVEIQTRDNRKDSFAFVDTAKFQPDTSVNVFFLADASSIEAYFGDLMPHIDRDAALPSFVVANAGKNEYLKLTFFPGSSANQFHEFEIGTQTNNVVGRVMPNIQKFVTGSGVSLGMTKAQIIQKFGKGNNDVNSQTLEYRIDDMRASEFLQRYNMPVYFARFEFNQKGILFRYAFGFEYP